MDRQIRVATFNCEWRRSASAVAALIRDRVFAEKPDIVCLTEAYCDFFGGEGHLIEASRIDPGNDDGRRKVLVWSRQPWSAVRDDRDVGLAASRFVNGKTSTPIGEIEVMGLCIPWRWAGVRTTSKLAVWEAHLAYLNRLEELVPPEPRRLIALGDFNQRVPPKYQPPRISEALERTLLSRLAIATAGAVGGIGRQAIDHICHSRDLVASETVGISNIGPSGRKISDHFGVGVSLTVGSAAPR